MMNIYELEGGGIGGNKEDKREGIVEIIRLSNLLQHCGCVVSLTTSASVL